MANPASTFEVGALRLEMRLQSLAVDDHIYKAPLVTFSPLTNKINILYFRTLDKASRGGWEMTCEALLLPLARAVYETVYATRPDPFTVAGLDEDGSANTLRETEVNLRVRRSANTAFSRGCRAPLEHIERLDRGHLLFDEISPEPPW
jgi:hypothetical protein